MKPMVRNSLRLITLLLTIYILFLSPALADDAGVLTEGELNNWIMQVLRDTKGQEPGNAPVGEESRTEEGYAFLYSFATLYYDKPALDQTSRLQGFAITDDMTDTPRGIRVGMPAEALIAAYGWQNHELFGDSSFAVLYQLDQLDQQPGGAYWCWAGLNETGGLTSVRCAIHAHAGNGRYTDAGVYYLVQDHVITAIRVYGLSQLITRAEAESNLRAVTAVVAAGSGDEGLLGYTAEGFFGQSQAPAFQKSDLHIAGRDFLTMSQDDALHAFGKPAREEELPDDPDGWLRIMEYDGLALTFALNSSRSNALLESLSITKPGIPGPRNLAIGQALADAWPLFRSDGTGATLESEALLYGDGSAAPYGTLERMGHMTTLRYADIVEDGNHQRVVTLSLFFENDRLTEILLHSW